VASAGTEELLLRTAVRLIMSEPGGSMSSPPQMESRTVTLAPFSLRESRTGSGPPLVLLHGLSGTSSWWRRNVAPLAERYTVFTLDLPMLSHFEDAAALVVRWIRERFQEPVRLIGHSMGGMIAVRVAASHPELVHSLVLANATGVPFALDARARLRHLPRPPLGLISFSRVLVWDFLRVGPAAVAAAGARVLTADAREAMTRIGVPTLIVWGDRDPLLPERHAEVMQETIAGSSLVVLPNAGHVSMWDNPGAFNRAVLEFFDDADDAQRGEPGVLRHAEWALAGCTGGICHRALGSTPTVVFVHGLGMSSSYAGRLAHALQKEGFDCVAPDLHGFGYSSDRPPRPAGVHARDLVQWAENAGVVERAVWIGHSTGCHVVREAAALAPDRVAGCVFLSPIWSARRRRWIPLGIDLLRDVFREPPSLVPEVAENYWRVGMLRWLRTFRYDIGVTELDETPADDYLIVAGARDPLADWEHLERIAPGRVERIEGGAHAVLFSHPAEVAAAVAPFLRQRLSLD
jgi:pimeloyl-ACP methyl ester carboxylesterase